jgi:hypothetical protein
MSLSVVTSKVKKNVAAITPKPRTAMLQGTENDEIVLVLQ